MPQPPPGKRPRLRIAPIDLVCAVATLGAVLALTRVYVSSERFFYYWDHAVFQDIAWNTLRAFQQSLGSGLRFLSQSFHDDYNAIFAIPLVPFLRIMGDSRLSYETALAVVYLCPFVWAVGGLATLLVPGSRRVVFWCAAWLSLLVPMTWVPTLRGYPDAGAATLFVLALTLHLRDADAKSPRNALYVGCLLALSIVFRRHFLYAAFALAGAVVLHGLLRAATRPRRWHGLAREVVFVARWLTLVALAGVVTTVVVAYGFFERLCAQDFLSLYRSYEEPLVTVFRWYLAPYGWVAWLAAGAGLLVGLRHSAHRQRSVFLVLFGGVSVLQWWLVVRQLGEQYTLQFTPTIVLGLMLLGSTVLRTIRRPMLTGVVTLGLCYLFANAGLGLASLNPGKDSPFRPLFAGRWAPLDRDDYDGVRWLVEYLHRDPPQAPGTGVYVAASSHLVNPDMVRHAEWALFGRDRALVNVLPVPDVDSRDYYPLGRLLDAEVVVVGDPVQYHLRPEEQRVLRVVHDLFVRGDAIAQDFSEQRIRFDLEDDVTTLIFRRRQPTSLGVALQTLNVIRSSLSSRPGMQTDWVVVGRAFPWWIERNPGGSTRWVAHPTRRMDSGAATVLAYIGAKPPKMETAGTVHFVDPRCQGATLEFSMLDAAGRLHRVTDVQRRPGEDGRFAVGVGSNDAGTLVLRLLDYAPDVSIDYCLLDINPLETRAPQP
jgi:uncharacterized membrane protein